MGTSSSYSSNTAALALSGQGLTLRYGIDWVIAAQIPGAELGDGRFLLFGYGPLVATVSTKFQVVIPSGSASSSASALDRPFR
jgi:hypothetical protein